MKRSILLFMIMCLAQTILAEDKGKNVLVDGRVWNYIDVYYTGGKNDTTYHYMKAKGPVEFDGKSCYSVGEIMLYEEGNCVYSYISDPRIDPLSDSTKEVEKIWWKGLDFNMAPDKDNGVSVDSIMIGDQLHRRVNLGYDIWVEGIGSKKCGPFSTSSWGPVPTALIDGRVISIYDGDECIFREEDFGKPAYTTDVKKVKNGVLQNETFYDLQGRRLFFTPPKGVYIQNGKKVIVK